MLILFAFVFPFNTALNNLIPPILLLLWFFDGDLKNKILTLFHSKIFLLLVVFIISVGISLLWSSSIYDGFWPKRYDNGISFWFNKYFLQFLIVPVLITQVHKNLFNHIISAFLIAMLISEMISYGNFFGIWQVGNGTQYNPAPFIHHIYYSIYLVMTIFILLIRFHTSHNKYYKIGYILFALVAMSTLFLNVARTGQLTLVIGLIYLTLIYYHLRLKTFLQLFALITTLVIIAYQFSPLFHQRINVGIEDIQKMQQNNFNSSFGQRVAMWITASEVIKENPILGAGLGDAKKEIADVQKSIYPHRQYIQQLDHAHNQFIQSYLEGGIFSFLLLCSTIFALFIRSFNEIDPYVKLFGISVLVLSLLDTPFYYNYGFLYVWFFMALFNGYHMQEKKLNTFLYKES